MVSMLRDAIDRGTGCAGAALGVRFPVGGKTGTTNEFKDAWFVGFSSSVVVGVWVGFDQPQPIGAEAYGARYALPIWADFMQRAARIRPPGSVRASRRAARRSAVRASAIASRWTGVRSTRSTSRKATTCRAACARFIADRSASA